MPYNHQDIESKWIKKWSDSKLYQTPNLKSGDKKKYILETFPYPSADGLHVGHTEGYTASDITARYARMTGHQVLYPMGWDAFGLPTENFAKKKGLHPQDVTDNSVANFKSQVMRLGASYDWEKEVNTSSPEYYKWTQWFFQLLHKRGLAYKKEALVNWDPVDNTVLANEQVIDGRAERSGALVEQKMMSQWFFKITDYAERLLEGLDGLDWPESTKQMQRNWIGKSVGAEVDFVVQSELNYLYIHGWSGSSDSNDLPIIRERYQKMGLKIQTPSLPNPENPNVEEQVEFILKNCEIDSNTVIVAHSLGAAVGLKVLEKLDFSISRFVAVGGFLDNQFYPEMIPEGISDAFGLSKVAFDADKIKNNCKQIKAIWSDDDQFVTKEQADRFEQTLDIPLIRITGYAHLSGLSQKIVQDLVLDKITVFTTAHDTIFGATFLVIAPEHEIVQSLTIPEQSKQISEYIEQVKLKSQFDRTEMNKDKTGVWTGSYAINPLNNEKIPIWIADYVLTNYGTGAVVAVPGEDERDFEFANKYNLPIIYTNHTGSFVSYTKEIKPNKSTFTLINSDEFNGMTFEKARPKILDKVESINAGKAKTTYRLRDWSIGRQRYWGCPIPVYYRTQQEVSPLIKGEVLIPEADLPLVLPQDLDLSTGMIKPLSQNQDFINSAAAKYGEGATYEGDTMDTFVCSSWYFFRYCSGNIDTAFAKPEDLKAWMPIDQYIIGAEHTVMHLLYSRFFTKVLFDAGYIDFEEPFLKLRHQGMILGSDNNKMSKSKGNVINPTDVFDEYGADTLRLYEMFMGPFDQPKPWSTESIKGVRRFLDKVWNMQQKVYHESDEATIHDNNGMKVEIALHKLVKKIGQDIESFAFNTCVSEFMKFANLVEEVGHIHIVQFEWFLRTLAPFAPFLTEEIWNQLKSKQTIFVDAINCLFTLENETVALNSELFGYLETLPQNKIVITNAKGNIFDQLQSLVPYQVYSLQFEPVKTDPQYFKKALVDLDLKPENILYFDHLQANIDSAKQNKIKSILYTSNEQIQTLITQEFSIHKQTFPEYDEGLTQDSQVTIGVQINGKVRGEVTLEVQESEESAKATVLELDFVKRNIEGKTIRKFVYVPGKIVNIVVGY
jgi:leucyl-tRNA synthetase/predicted alpha/beta hydrolase family esterase